MKVSELIEILKSIKNPENTNILFKDSASVNREIDFVRGSSIIYN